MSLQGTLDTFALPDVLRLLAATRKTGYLRLDGSRGVGGLWLADGLLSGVTPLVQGPPRPPVAAGVEALCDVLRVPDGAFAFEADTPPPTLQGEPAEVAPLLDAAVELLDEWASLSAVVPSLRCTLALAPALERESVVVSRTQWRHVVAIGSGTDVGALADALDLGELAVTRAVKDLVEAGLVAVGPAVELDEPVAIEPPAVVELVEEPAELEEPAEIDGPDDHEEEAVDAAVTPEADEAAVPPAAPEPAPQVASVAMGQPVTQGSDGFLRRPLGTRPAGPRGPGLATPLSASLGELASLSPSRRAFPGSNPPGPEQERDDDEAADVRRLADLGPGAAAAVAAATEASTPEERAAAIDAIEAAADGEPVNRSALLKFLSSVRS